MICFGNHEHVAPLNMIASARAVERHGVEVCRIQLKDGSMIADAGSWTRFIMTPVQLMPAAAGTEMVRAITDGDNPADWWVLRDPVIAWALCVDGTIRPVTPAGVVAGRREPDEGVFVKMPDGRVEAACEWSGYGSFDSVDAMLDQLLEDAGKSRAGTVRQRDEGEQA